MRQRRDDPIQVQRARALRRGLTKAEGLVWSRLRGSQLGVRFRRQEPMGNYIADFVCVAQRLVVEIDDVTHDIDRDATRDEAMCQMGFEVLRFTNQEVYTELDEVIGVIGGQVGFFQPTVPPPPGGGG